MAMIPSILVALTVALGGFGVATRRDHAQGACIAAIGPDPSPDRRLRRLSQVVSAVGMSRAARLPGRIASLREGWDAAGRPATFDAVLGVRLLLATAGLILGLAAALGTPLAIALGRSARLGTTIGSTLRSVAVDLRGERRARAEELARRAPIKMLFPLVFLILPAFLLLTVGPVVLAMLRSLH